MEKDTPAEAKLIAAAAAGNMGAFSQLVGQYRPGVLRTAYGVVGSWAEAEDVAQEAFIKVWNNLPQYHGEGSFVAWLYRITVNAAIDVLRKRRPELSLEDAQGQPTEPASPSNTTEETALHQDERQRVREAVEALPQGARTTLMLREYEQLSYKEIAEALNIPIGTVMSRLNYARATLRKRLAPPGG
jgi:RNA polymerase sigma-70 factor (ECF subfamily)